MSDVVTALKLSSEPGSSAAALCGPTTPLEGDHSAVDNEPGELCDPKPVKYSNGFKSFLILKWGRI